MSFPDLNYIAATDLAEKIAEPNGSKIVVIDVRNEEEFGAGHITGANNLPSTKWEEQAFVDSVIDAHAGEGAGATKFVLHCAHSQKRGPTCARILQDRLQQIAASTGADPSTLPSV
jgi:Cdc25 family phosphatase